VVCQAGISFSVIIWILKLILPLKLHRIDDKIVFVVDMSSKRVV
jgi:hypothetical protein